MPGGDRTGPMGMGAMTGRAAGFCAAQNTAGFAHPGCGRGFGAGMGRAGAGRGSRRFGSAYRPWRFGRGFAPSQTSDQEADRRAESLQEALDHIRQRLSALEANK